MSKEEWLELDDVYSDSSLLRDSSCFEDSCTIFMALAPDRRHSDSGYTSGYKYTFSTSNWSHELWIQDMLLSKMVRGTVKKKMMNSFNERKSRYNSFPRTISFYSLNLILAA